MNNTVLFVFCVPTCPEVLLFGIMTHTGGGFRTRVLPYFTPILLISLRARARQSDPYTGPQKMPQPTRVYVDVFLHRCH